MKKSKAKDLRRGKTPEYCANLMDASPEGEVCLNPDSHGGEKDRQYLEMALWKKNQA